jgi:type III restriction enzyme
MNENNKSLQQKLIEYFGTQRIENTPLPLIITNNLNPKFKLRPYQEWAFKYFLNYWENEKFTNNSSKHQLLFLMATGSGKTLMMAGLILYLYEKGYHNFLFFVNSTNIIDKTRDNFLNDTSIKYLFKKSLSSADKKISLREVDNFQTTDNDNISICFETIQGLHSRLNTPRENSLTYDDFQDKKMVLISDEAHHINVETKSGKQLSKEEREEISSWENTVNKIFAANSQNVLLEFTATIDHNNPYIWNKYAPRLVFDYPLKQFRIDGYSKEVKVLQTDVEPFDRALQAVLLSQYRRKIFEKNRKTTKPVILFKSKTINESKSFQEEFIRGLSTLTSEKLSKVETNVKDEFMVKMFKYFFDNKISLDNLIIELKEDFSAEKTLSVNSKEESEDKQLAVNTLEDPNNEYRAVFAVDKLNEGWDVLNLFDIVRLYDTRDAKNNVPGPTTIKEAQLIGRGARYCPFKINETDDPSQRKFDHDIQNEMRICEELYYHSNYNPRYIQELTDVLKKTGIIPDNTTKQNLAIKENFKNTKLYKTGLLFLNHQEKISRKDVFGLPSSLHDALYQTTLRTGFSLSDNLFAEKTKKIIERKEKIFYLKDFNKVVIRKALHKLHFYSFSNIKKYFPNLETLDEFISKGEYLRRIKINISGLAAQLEKLPTPDEQLIATIKVLEQIATSLSSKSSEWKGSKKFKEYLIKDKISDKTLNFAAGEGSDKELSKPMSDPHKTSIYLDVSKKSWHIFNDCYGTSEEKNFVKYIDKIYDQLKEKYEEIYLLRNERFFKLYNFDDGSPFEPDYVLFLYKKNQPKNFYYQVFIEPKGGYLEEKDAWKQKFLTSIKKEQQIKQLWEDREYIVWGMPFYNKEKEELFDKKFWETF